MRSDPKNATMPAIAQKAELSVATAYRYFPTLEELHSAFLHGVQVNLRDYALASTLHGKALFEDVVACWVRLLGTYGPAMIQVRSREGFMKRLRGGDEVIRTVNDAWERPIREVMRELGVSEDWYEHAILFYNALFDPREINDMLTSFPQTPAELTIATMVEGFYGAVQTLGKAGAPPPTQA